MLSFSISIYGVYNDIIYDISAVCILLQECHVQPTIDISHIQVVGKTLFMLRKEIVG